MNIAIQPIVYMQTYQIIAYEILCRPEEGIAEYFKVATPKELWCKEKKCLKSALDIVKDIKQPVHINITASSIPYFLESPYKWNGAVEIVEWGFPLPYGFGTLIKAIRRLGMDVWIDDLSPLIWPLFHSYSGVSGYKIGMHNLSYAKNIIQSDLPVIIEKIETANDAELAISMGVRLGQGYLYGKPQLINAEVKHESTMLKIQRLQG